VDEARALGCQRWKLSGPVVAVLSRAEVLGRVNAILRFPRRAAAFTLRHAQGLAAFRTLGRRAAPRFEIVVAREAECEAVHRQGAPASPASARAPP